jgi:hypothetical protein
MKMPKPTKDQIRRDAEKADRDTDARVGDAGQKLEDLQERSGKAEASYRAESAERRKAIAADVEKKLGKRD